jgi:bacillithiol biosynthesis cysteine-adding enzyme BshC
LKDGLRERIVLENETYKVISTDIEFTKPEILEELENFPERFSPNVIMRPLYQEVILPNLCYIGGGGELAYWFQLKSYFKSVNLSLPILLLRNSVLLMTKKQHKKLEKLNLNRHDLFVKQNELLSRYTKCISEIDIDFSKQKQHLVNQFKELYKIASQTDKSFLGAVAAQERKQLKGLEHLEKRLLKAQKRNLASKLERLTILQNQLFPELGLQERNSNFAEFYLKFGDRLFKALENNLQPLNMKFLILEL